MRILLNLICICIMFTGHLLLAQTELPLKDGWERINLKGIGHFDIPTSLKIPADKYPKFINRTTLEVGYDTTDITAISVGKDPNNKNDKPKYARVIFNTSYSELLGITQDTLNKSNFSEVEFKNFYDQAKKTSLESLRASNLKIFGWRPIQIENINGSNCIHASYQKGPNEKPITQVDTYYFPFGKMTYVLSIQYKIEEQQYWKTNLDQVIYSLELLAGEKRKIMVRTKDGVPIFDRESFIEESSKAMDKSMAKTSTGIKIDSRKYCECICDSLIPNCTSEEINESMKSGDFQTFISTPKNSSILLRCLDGKIKLEDDWKIDLNKSENPEIGKKLSIEICVKNLLEIKQGLYAWNDEMARQYCSCANDKIYSTGVITEESTNDLYNENSVIYNEITTECLGDILKSNKAKIQPDKEIIKSTVTGTRAFSKIDLLFLESTGYKIKLNIAGLERYFIFDTGASMMVIDQKLADELQKRKALKAEDILINSKFQLANGTIITSKIMELNNVRVGDYTLNHLEVAVIENGTLLFGSNALNNFSKWEINKEKKTLTLYK